MQFKPKYLVVALLASLPGLTLASGFQVWPQSGSAVGDYAAGAAASQTNVDVAYYNPAAMTYFTGQEAGFSAISQFQSNKFKGSITNLPTITGYSPNSGTVQGGQYTFLPSIMYVAPISAKWAFGLSISSPYRNYVRYGNSKFTRYNTTQNNFNTYDLAPSLAFKPTPDLSFGLGFDALYATESFTRKVTTLSTANESFSKNKGNGWGFGYHGGIFWKATSSTNVGLSYRSSIRVNAAGSSKLSGPLGSRNTRLKYKLTLPPMTILSIQQALNKKLTLMGSAVYTQWGQLNHFTLRNVATSTGTTTTNLVDHLRNTWRFILGSHYQLNNNWGLMGALGYQQSATRKTYRTIVLPDADSFLISLGVKYQIATNFAAEVGYTHLFNDKAGINQTQTIEGTTYNTVGNSYTNSDLIGVELDWKMT